MRALTSLLVAVLAPVGAGAQDRAGPEATIRAWYRAIYANDVPAYERLSLPHPRRSVLLRDGRRNEERLRALEDDRSSLQLRIARSFQLKGREIQPDGAGQYPVGASVRFVAAHGGSPTVVSLLNQPDGWKVDLRWWIAMTELTGNEPPKTTPDYAIKNLLLSMLALNRTAAERFVVPDQNREILWTAAPRYREPSGVLESSVVEMPLVTYGPGEFVALASGRIVEGVDMPDRQVLVGLFGPVEIGFVVRRVGSEWRVEPEPFFLLLNR